MSRPAGSGRRGGEARRVTVAIPSWNGRRHLETCLEALSRQRRPGPEWEVAVLDNGSRDGTAGWLERQHPEVRVLRAGRNLGFAAACNRLVEESDADAVALLNNDTRPAEGWLEALVEALDDAPPDVAAVAGKVVDWSGERLDFAGGIMTFDGHAFQRGFGRPLGEVELPDTGAEMFFASGSNMLVRRAAFLELGGFDADFFAYFEDVDFGWRAWAAGYRIVHAADAVVHHRSSATSRRLGNARRGFLFERNAFVTAYKNYDAELWPRMMPPILTTLLSRAAGYLDDAGLRGDWNPGDASWEAELDGGSGGPGTLVGHLRRLLPFGGDERSIRVDAQGEAHLRALTRIVRDLDRHAARRETTQARRERSDREILGAFPPHVVPTYPGDEDLFASDGFRQLLPRDVVPFVHSELDRIMEVA